MLVGKDCFLKNWNNVAILLDRWIELEARAAGEVSVNLCVFHRESHATLMRVNKCFQNNAEASQLAFIALINSRINFPIYGMASGWLPIQSLFGELQKTRPRHGTKKRWRHTVTSHLQMIGMTEEWYESAQDRQLWFQTYTDCIK